MLLPVRVVFACMLAETRFISWWLSGSAGGAQGHGQHAESLPAGGMFALHQGTTAVEPVISMGRAVHVVLRSLEPLRYTPLSLPAETYSSLLCKCVGPSCTSSHRALQGVL